MGLLILIYTLIYFAPLIVGWASMGIQKKIKFVHGESGINNNGFIGLAGLTFSLVSLSQFLGGKLELGFFI